MSVGQLGGVVCSRMRLQVPSWGAWWLDAETTEPVDMSRGARVTAQIAERTLQGTIVNGYSRDGAAGYRIVGGAGGWGAPLPAKSYHNDAGVKLSTVVGDVASEVGETISGVSPSARLGAHFARVAGETRRPASWILNYYFPRGWYVADDGTTQIGQRPVVTYSGEGARVVTSPAANVIELDVEALANLAPGVTIDGSEPATDVEVNLDARRLRVRLYSAREGATARRLAAWAKLIDALVPDLKYRGCYEFRVVSQDGERFDLQPVLSSLGFDDLELVPVRGPAGTKAKVKPGELVVVTFVNAQPDRPAIIAHDDPEAPGFMPLEVAIEAQTKLTLDGAQVLIGGDAASLGVARMTDPVVCGPLGGTITQASTTVKAKS